MYRTFVYWIKYNINKIIYSINTLKTLKYQKPKKFDKVCIIFEIICSF